MKKCMIKRMVLGRVVGRKIKVENHLQVNKLITGILVTVMLGW